MYKLAYARLFWGLVLIIFSFRIQGFDILPDVVGYLLIAIALLELSRQHGAYGKGIPYAWLMMILSLIGLFQTPTVLTTMKPMSSWDYAVLLLEQTGIVLRLFLFYWMTRAIGELALDARNYLLHSQAVFRWKLNLWLTVIILLGVPFAMNLPKEATLFLILPILLQFVAMLLLLALIYRAKRELVEENTIS